MTGKYETVTYDTLLPDQVFGGLVTRWWSSESRPGSLLLAGRTRTGKTTVGYAIANHAYACGSSVAVYTTSGLAKALRNWGRSSEVWKRATSCDLLFLDDWGRERVTDWWREQLHELLDVRSVGAGRRLLVTAATPVDADAAYLGLVERYGDPIVERVIDGGGVLMFDGDPIRNLLSDW